MALTPEDIDKLTIGEVRAIASQAGEALEKLRAVQTALGLAPVAQYTAAAQVPPLPALPPAQSAALAAWHADPERQRLLDLNRNAPEEAGPEFAP